MSQRDAPAPRDQAESPFTEILEGFWRAHPSVLAASFVDREGECIDYFSSIDPYEAKVAGAHMVAVRAGLTDHFERAGLGELRLWTVESEHRDFVVARVSDEYVVVLVLHALGLTARVLESLEGLIEAFSAEAGVPSEQPAVRVQLAPSESGRGDPIAIHLAEGVVQVDGVVARWSEPGSLSAEPLRCYRVRLVRQGLPQGVPPELTLVHDVHLDRYRVRRRPGDAV